MTQQWRLMHVILADELASGEWRPGERLPSEHDLAERFQVSRNTVRRALLALSQEGRVRIVNGRGSFAMPSNIVYEVDAGSRLHETLARLGAEPTVRFLEGRVRAADARLAALLERPEGSPVAEIVSLLFSRDLPLVLSHRHLPAELVPDLVERFRNDPSITRILAAAGLGRLRRESTTVSSRPPSVAEAEALMMPANAALLMAEGLGRLGDGRMAEVNLSMVPAHLVHFRFRSG